MKRALPWMASLLTACAMLRGGGPPVNTEVWARSHNASDVDVGWGFKATDEMCQMAIVYTPGDPSAKCVPVETSDGVILE